MGNRTIGTGRGAVFIEGVRYDEGATVPDGAPVGDHVFTDVDPVEGNVTWEPVQAVVAADASGADAGPADGTIDEVLARVGTDQAAAQAALDAEQAKGDKARKSLVEKLQAVVAADGSGAGS